jgi:hypothetical protein
MRASLVAVAGALAALALWQAAPRPDGRSDLGTAAPPRAETHAAAPAATTRPPTHVARAIERALDRHIETAGLAGRVSPADRAALRDALVAMRRASLRARRRSRDPAWQAEQSRALVAADRLFREKLGVGLAEFVADAGPPGRVEDLGRPAS